MNKRKEIIPKIGDPVITETGEYSIIELGDTMSGKPFVVSLEGNKVAVIEIQWTSSIRTLWIQIDDE